MTKKAKLILILGLSLGATAISAPLFAGYGIPMLGAVEWIRAGLASQADPVPVDYPQIDTPRSQQKLCANTATQLDSMVCTDGLVVKELAAQSERCYVGGSGVTTAAGFELDTTVLNQIVANADVIFCISATGACTVTAYCGDRS